MVSRWLIGGDWIGDAPTQPHPIRDAKKRGVVAEIYPKTGLVVTEWVVGLPSLQNQYGPTLKWEPEESLSKVPPLQNK